MQLESPPDRSYLARGLPMPAVVLAVALALPLLRSPTISVEIGDPDEPIGVMRYADGRVDLRSGPGPESAAINFLSHAQGVIVGEPDANGWVAVLDPLGDTIGFVDSASMSDFPPPSPGRFMELEGLVVPVR